MMADFFQNFLKNQSLELPYWLEKKKNPWAVLNFEHPVVSFHKSTEIFFKTQSLQGVPNDRAPPLVSILVEFL